MNETLAVVGGGAIATGLAAVAAQNGGGQGVVIWVRSDESAARTQKSVDKLAGRLEIDPATITVTTDMSQIASASAVIEAIAEDLELKTELWSRIQEHAAEGALLGSTTSSLSVQALAEASGAPDRFVALHVFNPVTHMKLVELAYATQVIDDTKARAQALCEALGKTAVNVPDTPGFIVNRLLFPYLFDAVNFQAESGLSSEAIDTAMKLGAGHPMGPLALIDYVGLDVSKAIAEQIGTPIPARIDELIAEGALGKKAGRGFYDYS